MSYKDDQKAARESLKPRVIEQHWGANRAQKRHRRIDRTYTKAGFERGVRMGTRRHKYLKRTELRNDI